MFLGCTVLGEIPNSGFIEPSTAPVIDIDAQAKLPRRSSQSLEASN
jgi:hypothetical protein